MEKTQFSYIFVNSNPQKKNILEQEERISSYRNQFSISANMIVSTGVSCGMGYYIGDQMKFDKPTVGHSF